MYQRHYLGARSAVLMPPDGGPLARRIASPASIPSSYRLNWRSRSFALLLARRSNWIAKHGRSLALERQIENSQSRVFPALAGHPCNFHPGVFASTVLGYALATPPGAARRFARVTATPDCWRTLTFEHMRSSKRRCFRTFGKVRISNQLG